MDSAPEPGHGRRRQGAARLAEGDAWDRRHDSSDDRPGLCSEGWDSDAYLAAAAGYVETMYEGKESLRPLFDALVEMARSLGADIRICPCTTIVPLYRTHVFGEIKPTTKTRVDLGLALRGVDGPLPENLIDTGGLAKKDCITHRFALSSVDDIDGDVREWLGVAYGLDG